MNPFFVPAQSVGQPTKQPKGQRFAPAIFGTWRVGTLQVAEKGQLRPAVLVNSMESGLTVLPTGLFVAFKPDYDPVGSEALSIMEILPPFPPEACQNGTLWGYCVGSEGNRKPNAAQQPLKWEFGLAITKEDVFDTFAAVGATQKDVCYRVRVNGRGWLGNFYVSKDRQTMWTDVYVDTYTVQSDGSKRTTEKTAQRLQVYHRVSDVNRVSTPK